MKKNIFYESVFILLIIILHILLRKNSAYLDLPPFSFIDEGMYAQNSYGMYFDHKITPPIQSLAGGFTYYICYLSILLCSLFSDKQLNVEEAVIITRFTLIIFTSLMPIYIFKTLKLLNVNSVFSIGCAIASTVSPLSLALTRVVYPDHFVPGLISPLIYYLCLYLNKKNTKYLIYIAALSGLLISTKYSSSLIIFSILILILINNYCVQSYEANMFTINKQVYREIFCYLLIISFIFLILNFDGILRGDIIPAIVGHHAHYSGEHFTAQTDHGIQFYSSIIFFLSYGVLGGVFILTGFCCLFVINKRLLVFFLLFFLISILTLGSYHVVFSRNISALLPFVFLLLGVTLQTINVKLPFKRNIVDKILLLVIISISIEPLYRSYLQIKYDRKIDSRVVAHHWILSNIPKQDKIGYIHGAWGAPYTAHYRKNLVIINLPSNYNNFKDVDYYITDSWSVEYIKDGVSLFAFIPFSDHHFINISQDKHPEIYYQHKQFLTNFTLVKEFQNNNYYGPEIKIYKNNK